MSDDVEEKKCPPEGLPAYMGTFADLMSLLMCFFVLLLAFSEMDVLKFKQIAVSMKFAFGVQNKLEVKDIPKGTSVIAREFTPGKPQPTVIQTIMQQTMDVTKDVLEFEETEESEGDGSPGEKGKVEIVQESSEKAQAESEKIAQQIARSISKELQNGMIELLAKGGTVIIRIRESGSFGSGSAYIKPEFRPVAAKIAKILVRNVGKIRVVGHTDNIPIDTEYFPSNWELSAGRAASVVRELLKNKNLSPDRFEIAGMADVSPVASNATSDGRAKNRRVEIMIMRGDAPVKSILGVKDSETGNQQ